MKVVCVDDSPMWRGIESKLTLNKLYETGPLENEEYCAYTIVNDTGAIMTYAYWRFITIDKHRDKRLKELEL